MMFFIYPEYDLHISQIFLTSAFWNRVKSYQHKKFLKDPFITFGVVMDTDKQTNEQILLVEIITLSQKITNARI